MIHLIRHFTRWAWLAVATGLILLAVVLTVARLALPFAGEYRAEIEAWMSDYLGAPVTIGELDVEWHRLGPRLRLESVSVIRPDGDSVTFDEALVDLALAPREWTLRARNVSLVGLRIDVRRDDAGHLHFWGMTLEPERVAEVIGEVEPDDALDADLAAMLEGLLAVRQLEILDMRIVIRGPDDRREVIPQLDLRLLNDERRHRFAIDIQPPPDWGRRFELRLEGSDLLDPDRPARGRIYLRADGFVLERAHGFLDETHIRAASGRADVELWTEWRDERIVGAIGESTMHGIRIETVTGAEFGADALGGRLEWQRTDEGWALHGENLRMERAGRAWPATNFSLWREASADAPVGWRGGFDFLRLEDVERIAAILPLPDHLAGPLDEFAPAGDLRDVAFTVVDADMYAVRAGFDDLTWRPRGAVPGARGLTGRLQLTGARGSIDLDSRDAAFHAPRLFRAAQDIDLLTGRVDLARARDGLRIRASRIVAANADIETESRLDLRLVDGMSPWIDMQVDFADGDGATTSRYLPVGIMHPGVVEWLDTAIVEGTVPEGRMLLRGETADFPYHGHEGVFEVDFDVAGMTLDYAPPWPALEAFDGRVRFHGPSLTVEGDHGRIRDAEFPAIHARFDDLVEGLLRIEARSETDLGHMIDFVQHSPLQENLGGFFDGAEGTAPAALDLALEIPVTEAAETRVRGDLHLDGNRLHQPRFGLDLDGLRGLARFTEQSLALDDFTARFNGRPVDIAGWTDAEGMHIQGQGDLDIAALVPALADQLSPWIAGAAPWRIRVRVPGMAPGVDDDRIIVVGDSRLEGMEINLPAPLAKDAATPEATAFALPIRPGAETQRLDLSMGDRLRLAVEMGLPDDGEADFLRATAHFGQEIARLRAERGLFIDGRIEVLDLAAWLDLLPPTEDRAMAAPATPLFAGAEVAIGRVDWRDRHIEDVDLGVQQLDDGWRVDIDSPMLAGHVFHPFDPRGTGSFVRVDLDHLDLARGEEKEKEVDEAEEPETETDPLRIDPSLLPPLNVRIGALHIDGVRITSIGLLTRPVADGLIMHHIEAGERRLRLSGHGEWRMRDGVHRTELRIPVEATDLGAGLAAMGIETSMVRGEGRVVADLSWVDVPWSPDLESLGGTVRVDLRKGVIEDVDPGPARLVGFFSVLTVPRRLALDFSDLLERGYSYDRIEGQINLQDGQAYTRNFVMVGPAGRLQISGRAGYIDEDFDQEIVFRPAFAYSLPIIGTITGGTGVGLAFLVTQGLLRGLGTGIDDIVEQRYTLTGTWAEPKVERVRRPVEEEPPTIREPRDAVPRP